MLERGGHCRLARGAHRFDQEPPAGLEIERPRLRLRLGIGLARRLGFGLGSGAQRSRVRRQHARAPSWRRPLAGLRLLRRRRHHRSPGQCLHLRHQLGQRTCRSKVQRAQQGHLQRVPGVGGLCHLVLRELQQLEDPRELGGVVLRSLTRPSQGRNARFHSSEPLAGRAMPAPGQAHRQARQVNAKVYGSRTQTF